MGSLPGGFAGGSGVKNPPPRQETCSIPGSGRFPGQEMATHSRIFVCNIPWMEDPGRLPAMELQESDRTERLSTHKRREELG